MQLDDCIHHFQGTSPAFASSLCKDHMSPLVGNVSLCSSELHDVLHIMDIVSMIYKDLHSQRLCQHVS